MKQIIAELNGVLRGWGHYFRTGNADREFTKLDRFVVRRMRRWQRRRGAKGDTAEGLDPRPAPWDGSASPPRHGVLSDASHTTKIIVKLCAGKPLAQFERGLHGNGPAVDAGTAP